MHKKKNINKIIISSLLLITLVTSGYIYYSNKKFTNTTILPEQGTTENQYSDLIQVASPLPNEQVKNPIVIEGRARGNWYFEASFPITLLDEKGNQIASTVATAQGEWMTNDFVPFKALLNLNTNLKNTKATLILHKDNPSGLKENDKQVEIPITF